MTRSGSDSTSVSLETTDDASVRELDGPARERVETSLRRLDRLASLLDDQFRIPGTDIRFGLDPLLGLLAGGGDWVAWVAGVYVIWEAARLEVQTRTLFRMSGYVLVDLVVGYVPVLGDLFDVAYRSNRKNVELLFDHFDYRKRGGSTRELPETLPQNSASPWKTYLTVTVLIGVLTLLAAVPFVVVWWLLGG